VRLPERAELLVLRHRQQVHPDGPRTLDHEPQQIGSQ
jgi:hypothetical protein